MRADFGQLESTETISLATVLEVNKNREERNYSARLLHRYNLRKEEGRRMISVRDSSFSFD